MKNIGQTAPSIQYYVDAAELRAGFTVDSVVFQKHQEQIQVKFVDSNPGVQIEGNDQMSGSAHFFTNSFSTPQAAASLYRTLLYRNLYPSIDLNFRASGTTIKSEFVVRPGANVETIRLRYPSDCRISIDPAGDLLVRRGATLLQENAPSLYQEISGKRVTVHGAFQLLEPTLVGFQVASYDLTQPLTIDPVVTYATYLGGSSFSAVTGIAADTNGNLYATGWTEALNFPIVGAAQAANGGGVDAFVVKFNGQGTNILYATYIGGSGDDRAAGIAVDSSGNAYITGATESPDFPMVLAAKPTINGITDAFVLKLNSIGNQLIYSTYLGGSGWDAGVSIAVDGSGNAYVAGNTQSADFPLLKPVQATLGGATDAFVTALSPAGGISFSTFLGGASDDIASSIATDSSANIYITGGTYSSNFPTVGAFQGTNAGGEDVFITKLKSGGGSIIYSTYLGGNGIASGIVEQGAGIASDASGNAYIAGVTNSANFPTTPGVLQQAMTGVENAFIAKLSPTGSTLVYSTYLGGSSRDFANAIAIGPSGTVWVAGFTSSLDFPLVSPLQSTFGGMTDAFVAQINSGATALSFSTFFGGSRGDIATSLALDTGGNVFVGGQTNSIDLPLTAPYGSSNNAGATGWLMKLGSSVSTPTLAPASGTYSSSQTVTISTTTSGAAIRYTVNGMTPSGTVGTVYNGPITVSSTTTINAIAYAAGQADSSVASTTFTIQLATITTAANASVVYCATSQNATLTATVTTSGATVNSGAVAFTALRGTTPIGSSAQGTVRNGFVSVTFMLPAGTAAGSYTIQATFQGVGYGPSSDSTHTLTVGPAQVTTPTFSPGGGTYSGPQSVTISTMTSGASIRYTTDGSTPTSSSTVYVSPITLSATTTLTIYASATGMTDSSVASATYSISSAVNGYSHYRAITINSGQVSGTLPNFPLLISGQYSYLATTGNGGNVTNGNGYDIIFTSDQQGLNKLQFERESYSPTTGAINYWVQMPTTFSNSTVIYMFYGNSSVTTDQSNKTGTWDSNYVGVYHFGDGTTLSANGSTSNAVNGAITGATATTGKIYGAGSYNGTTGTYIDYGSGTALNTALNGSFTVSAWINPTNTSQGVFFGNSDGNEAREIGMVNGCGTGIEILAAEEVCVFSSGSNLSTGVWHYIVWTYDANSNTNTLYIDGSPAGSVSFNFAGVPFAGHYYTSNGAGLNTRGFNGGIDETRVSSTARSASWILAEYNNQNSTGSFYSVGLT